MWYGTSINCYANHFDVYGGDFTSVFKKGRTFQLTDRKSHTRKYKVTSSVYDLEINATFLYINKLVDTTWAWCAVRLAPKPVIRRIKKGIGRKK
jgi:hypothetical protein